jgi:hypothetical protein
MNAKHPNRVHNVLQGLLAYIFKRYVELTLDVFLDLAGDADTAGNRKRFKSSRDIHPVAHNVAVALSDDITDVDSDPKLESMFRWSGDVARFHGRLDGNTAPHGVDHTCEFREQAVARGFEEAAIAARKSWVRQFVSYCLEPS